MILGITGSSGAGKSSVCEILQNKYQFKIINADEIARKLSRKGTAYLEEIVENFGQEILLPNQELDRKKLAQIIYHDSECRNLLNKCTLKYIKKEIQKQLIEYTASKEKIKVAIDAPLLFEAKLEEVCDYTVAVISENKEMQLQRIVQRDNLDEEHAKARIKAQPENAYYIEKCDYKIINDSEIEDMEKQIKKILSQTTKNLRKY